MRSSHCPYEFTDTTAISEMHLLCKFGLGLRVAVTNGSVEFLVARLIHW
jgi:hypothetical protein